MKPFSRPPELEPLGDLSWRRLEDRVLDELATSPASERRGAWSPSRRLVIAGGSMLAAAAAIALVWMSSGEKAPVATSPADLSRLVTEAAPSSMSIGDASLAADSNTALWVANYSTTGRERGIDVMLERGSVECTVAKRPDRPPFRVIAGNVTVTVTGTIFRVERDGDSARVSVTRGSVEVLSNGTVTQVKAGETWPERVAASSPAVLPTPETNKPVAKRPAIAKPAPRPAPRTTIKTKPERKSAKVRYAEAAALEVSDPVAALALYRDISREGGAWAAIALYAKGRLELERGRHKSARRSLKRYLKKYPSGTNARDARRLLQKLEP